MLISIENINRAGLSDEIVTIIQSTDPCKKYISAIENNEKIEPVKLYKHPKTKEWPGHWTLADGIHRFCAHLFYNKQEIDATFI